MAGALITLWIFASALFASADNNFFTVLLASDSNSRYLVPANILSSNGTGPSAQRFSFALSMGTPYISVAGSGCTSCDGASSYDATGDPSASSSSSSGNFTLLGGASSSGQLVTVNCQLPTSNGSAWSYPNQTMLVTNQSNALYNSQVSGILGLQPGAGSVVGGVFTRNPQKPSFTYGMALNPPSANGSDAGVLHWTGSDPLAYVGQVSWKNTSSTIPPSTASPGGVGSAYTYFVFDAVSVQVQGTTVVSSSQTFSGTLDPYVTDIYLPANQVQAIYNKIPNSSPSPGDNGQSTVWTIPCGTTLGVGITIGTITFPLDQSQLTRKTSTGTCLSRIRGWSNATTELYLFGSSFISTIYVIVQAANPAVGQTDQMGFAMRKSNSSTPVGAIVGGTVGGVAGLVIVGLVIFFLVRRRRRNREGGTFDHDETNRGVGTSSDGSKIVQPFPYQSPAHLPTTLEPLLPPPNYDQIIQGGLTHETS